MFKQLCENCLGNLGASVILATFLVSMFGGYAPTIEGKLFPVTINTEIEEIRPTTDGNSLVRLTFENVRDCRYLNLDWFKKDDDGRFRSIYVNFLKDANTGSRGMGLHRTQTWYVEMPSDIVADYSLVRVRHQCHPFWDTSTQIIP
jgi:hypothetical protein